jgi:DNA replication ATP-dependent helicase Dna2
VASFGQSEGLLRLKKFQRLIVDEASQILEPQLVGLLTRFEYFVLIGDHRQLPAVTTQSPRHTKVEDPDLNAIGLMDLRDSYFERMYRRCVSLEMTESYTLLDRQGRMHEDIMAFPNKWFYEGNLKILASPNENEPPKQQQPLDYKLPENATEENKKWASQRVLFVPVAPENALPGQKTHAGEAAVAAQMVAFFKKLYEDNGLAWNPTKSLGIITPWRAQIAQIRMSMTALGLDPDEITIDTVERYQGGARDVIIISTCVHSEIQLSNLVSLSNEGVDRKLNVALTRARQHVLLLGNKQVLSKDPRYAAFIIQYSHNLKGN